MHVRIDLVPGNAWLPLAVRQASRRGLTRLRIVAGVLIVIGGLSAWSGISPTRGVVDATDLGVGGALLVTGCLWLLVAQRSPGRAVKLQPRYVLTEPGVIEVTDSGVVQTYPSAQIAFAWSAFVRVVETPQMWLLYTGRVGAIYVPKEPLTEAQRAELAAHINGIGIPAAAAH
jgi:hypothetical protein